MIKLSIKYYLKKEKIYTIFKEKIYWFIWRENILIDWLIWYIKIIKNCYIK